MLAAVATALGVEEPLREKLVRLALVPIPLAADCCIVDLGTAESYERACLVVADPSRTAGLREMLRQNPPGPQNPVVDVQWSLCRCQVRFRAKSARAHSAVLFNQ